MKNFHPRSVDPPSERPAPTELRGLSLGGERRVLALTRPTLVVAVKANCEGCHAFVHGELEDLAELEVVVVSATGDESGEWRGALRAVLVAPEVLDELAMGAPPYYVLIDPRVARIVCEGVPFHPSQVAREIAPYLSICDVTDP